MVEGSGSILVVGEALVDVVRRADGTVEEHPGGSPANVALGLARLGRSTHLLTHLGDDARGARVAAHLEGDGVQLVPGAVHEGPTSTAQATIAADGSATYEFSLAWDPVATDLPADPVAVHVGSIATTLQPGAGTVEQVLRGSRASATTCYDPNLRPAIMGSPAAVGPTVARLVAAADVVKVSDEELGWLTGGADPEQVVTGWLDQGPAVVVMTRGSGGALALCRDGRVDVAAPRVEVADTVGAGDSFMAALIDALWTMDLLGARTLGKLRVISTEQLDEAVRHAVAAAAITVSRPGADPPTRAELQP